MSDSQKIHPLAAQASSVEGIADIVWTFMTSIKEVQKRHGEKEPFNVEKLHQSICAALQTSGLYQKEKSKQITEHVVIRLTKIFDGHTVPQTRDIRDMVQATLIDHNLIPVAKDYSLSHFSCKGENSEQPVYGTGLTVKRYFTKDGIHPFEEMVWEKRTASITDSKGKVVFEQKDVEIPQFWSQTATNIVVAKYFRGKVGDEDRETSVKQLVKRVATTMTQWGRKDGYFQTAQDADIFEEELTFILVNQMAAFNSPVWFNVGVNPRPQCSACFINSVQDDMRSILNLAVTEGMLFKGGSGTGTNLSRLRSSCEYLGGSNGKASGPVSFMRGYDAFAEVIKSGGKTRRAAKMVILNVDHPDIEEFITCKAREEKKAWALMDAGYDGSIDGEAYHSISFQNANNSVRVTDAFMEAVEKDDVWVTKEVTTGKDSRSFKARDLMQKIGEAAWQCGDPGLQYDTTANKWHTCKTSGRINASNPCSEFMFLDDSSCNLSSLNLLKFRKEENGKVLFDIKAFTVANEIMITAMEILVENSTYPTPAIEQNSYDFRPLGIGYANLGALLMSRGLAYDSQEGRNLAAAITSLQSAVCYKQSTKIAEQKGSFSLFEKNKDSCLEVMELHRQATCTLSSDGIPEPFIEEANKAWNEVKERTGRFGLRNAQISLLAPTGTIAFLMDCDTTGVEPEIALVKYKWLVGGGMIKMVNQTIPEALRILGYSLLEIEDIVEYIDKHDTIEGAPYIQEKHLPVFDCAFQAKNGKRTIHYMGHLRMMAAVQPFLSGAISKTVNMPHEATVEDIVKVYQEGWKMGLKAIAIYRDGSKRQQVLTTSQETDQSKKKEHKEEEPVSISSNTSAGDGREDRKPVRRRLPDERRSITHKFSVANHQGYVTVGLYVDGTPGEIFITISKEGSVIRGLMDAFATSVSIGLQYGVPLSVLINKFVHMRFEPSGYTNNPNIRIAKSIVDYIFRWMALKFLTSEEQKAIGVNNMDNLEESFLETTKTQDQPSLFSEQKREEVSHTSTFDNQSDAPPCNMCGAMMVRNGSCYKCLNCGATSGCS